MYFLLFLGVSKESKVQNPKLLTYKDYLQTCYKGHFFLSSPQWPPIPTKRIFKLAMIQKDTIQRGTVDHEFVQLSITGKVDDILQHKTPIEIDNIFSKCETEQKFVLIEGAPGSGKSTLAMHICREWAEGRLFREYMVVVLIRLRDPHIKKAKTIADLLLCTSRAMADETEAILVSIFGKGMLWLLDGWDELPSNLPSDSIVFKIVQSSTS